MTEESSLETGKRRNANERRECEDTERGDLSYAVTSQDSAPPDTAKGGADRESSETEWPCWRHHFGLLALRTVRDNISVSEDTVCGDLETTQETQ